jgi:prevent-host-death family protein
MQMITITSVEFQRNFGLYQDTAFKEPIAITRNGRERIVVLSAEEYHRLKRRDRQVMRLEDLTEADLQAILQAEPPPEAAAFNHEVEG